MWFILYVSLSNPTLIVGHCFAWPNVQLCMAKCPTLHGQMSNFAWPNVQLYKPGSFLIIESPATQAICTERLEALSHKSLFLSHCIEGRNELSQIINTYLRLGSI